MLAPNLDTQILQFVEKFYVVKERQILKFFRDWGKGEVDFAYRQLLNHGRLIRCQDNPEYISTVRHLPHNLSEYDACIQAVDVMLMLTSKQIVWFSRLAYPMELTFCTTDSVIYSVVVFDSQWVTKYSLIPSIRGLSLPAGMPDPANYVAVVPDEDTIYKVEDLGFSMYAIIDQNGHAETYTLD